MRSSPKGRHELPRHGTHQGPLIVQGMGGEPSGGVRPKADIGIDEKQMRAARDAGQLPAGMRLAGPARRQGGSLGQPDPRVASRLCRDDVTGAVSGAVVHDDDLDRDADACAGGLQSGADVGRLVAGGDQDGDERAIGQRR